MCWLVCNLHFAKQIKGNLNVCSFNHSERPPGFFPWGQKITNTCCLVCFPDVFPCLVNKVPLIWLSWHGLEFFCEKLRLLNPKLSCCVSGMTRIKFCTFWLFEFVVWANEKKEKVALGTCGIFPGKNRTKGHIKENKRLTDLQSTHTYNVSLWEVDV